MSDYQITPRLKKAACAVKLIAFDLDGTLTDGRITYDSKGGEYLSFNTHDDVGIRFCLRAGIDCAIISGRNSSVAEHHAEVLGIRHVELGAKIKQPVIERLMDKLGLDYGQLCFIGDDIPDMPVVRNAVLGVAVADARNELKQSAHLVTHCCGGCGAVRETVELVLKAQNLWPGILERYRE